jgi:hypothetical protein
VGAGGVGVEAAVGGALAEGAELGASLAVGSSAVRAVVAMGAGGAGGVGAGGAAVCAAVIGVDTGGVELSLGSVVSVLNKRYTPTPTTTIAAIVAHKKKLLSDFVPGASGEAATFSPSPR